MANPMWLLRAAGRSGTARFAEGGGSAAARTPKENPSTGAGMVEFEA
jgi:hypothetical protein